MFLQVNPASMNDSSLFVGNGSYYVEVRFQLNSGEVDLRGSLAELLQVKRAGVQTHDQEKKKQIGSNEFGSKRYIGIIRQ